MADDTTATTPPAQDLQINLADSSNLKESSVNSQGLSVNSQEFSVNSQQSSVNDLDLNLDLSEAPKSDDRLQNEDKKNTETVAPSPITETSTKIEEIIPNTAEVITKGEPETGNLQPATDVIPSSKVEVITPEEIITKDEAIQNKENLPESSSLKEDKKIIDELEGHPSAGGLSPEVITKQPVIIETPKTFDLDAMLGAPVISTTKQTEILLDLSTTVGKGGNEGGFKKASEPAAPVLPAFTIPTPTTQVPVQGVMQPSAFHAPSLTKHIGVKTLFLLVAFVSLGFTTFFILKTMYPIEFGNMFAGADTPLHASSEVITGAEEVIVDTGILIDTGTVNEVVSNETGTEIPSTILTGLEENTGDVLFGELNDLGTPVEEPVQTDVGRLTEYVTQGTAFREQGKTLGNNTVIKYGLYISKKSTAFLEDIANGKEITNLTGYFAQFDQYIVKLQEIVGTTPSSLPPANDTTETTETTISGSLTAE